MLSVLLPRHCGRCCSGARCVLRVLYVVVGVAVAVVAAIDSHSRGLAHSSAIQVGDEIVGIEGAPLAPATVADSIRKINADLYPAPLRLQFRTARQLS